MSLIPGFYVVEKKEVGKTIPRPATTMSIIAFLRAAHMKNNLPHELLVTGLDRLLHRASHSRKAAITLSQMLNSPPIKPHLNRQAPVVILPVEYLELGEKWKAGIRSATMPPQEVFLVEWIFPKLDMRTVGSVDVAYSVL
jgi:hypothetical protein